MRTPVHRATGSKLGAAGGSRAGGSGLRPGGWRQQAAGGSGPAQTARARAAVVYNGARRGRRRTDIAWRSKHAARASMRTRYKYSAPRARAACRSTLTYYPPNAVYFHIVADGRVFRAQRPRCPLPAARCPLFTARCPLPAACCPLPAARSPLLASPPLLHESRLIDNKRVAAPIQNRLAIPSLSAVGL